MGTAAQRDQIQSTYAQRWRLALTAPIPNDSVLLVCSSNGLLKPWGCGRLSDLRPRLVVTGAPTVASEFFGRHTPVEVYTTRPGDCAGLLSHALTKGASVHCLILDDGVDLFTQEMITLCLGNGVHLTVLKQLPPKTDDWTDDLREELYEVSGRYINDRIKSLSDPITDKLKQSADSFAEGVIRSEFAWR